MSSKNSSSCKALIKDYCANCTFAGVHFIADDTKHLVERLLWVILIIVSWYGSTLLIIAAWDSFVTSPISFGVETNYLHWDAKLPAVAVCETSNDNKVYDVSDTIWPPGHLLDLEDALKDIAYFKGVSFTLVDVCYMTDQPDPLCPTNNFTYYANLIRSNCDDFLVNCSYNNKEFPCCEYFQPLDTDVGTCFIINSIQTKNPKPYPMVSNLRQKQSILRVEVLLSAMVYTLGEVEVPTVTTLQSSTMKIQLGSINHRQVTVRNIENDPLIVYTTPEQRACHFHDENEGGVYPKYSYSACTVQCRKKGQMDMCGCNDHFMVGSTESERCNLSGVACLHQYSTYLTTLKPSWQARPGLSCNCLPSCDETEITVIKDAVTQVKGLKNNKKKARIEVSLAYLATERFKRNVVRSRMDLVVSVGGTTGLFVGASLLSFVELIFYFTVRYSSNVLMERRRQKRQNRAQLRPVVHVNPKAIGDTIDAHVRFSETVSVIKVPYVNSGLILSDGESYNMNGME